MIYAFPLGAHDVRGTSALRGPERSGDRWREAPDEGIKIHNRNTIYVKKLPKLTKVINFGFFSRF